MRKLLFTIIFILAMLFPLTTFGQDKDRVILTIGAGADEYTYVFDTAYEAAVKGTVNVKVVGSKTRLGAKFVFDRLYDSKRYSGGAELSHTFKFVAPFGHILIGKEYLNSSVISDFIRTLGAGVRVNLGYLVLIPLQIDSTRGLREPFGSPGVTQFSASVGVRF